MREMAFSDIFFLLLDFQFHLSIILALGLRLPFSRKPKLKSSLMITRVSPESEFENANPVLFEILEPSPLLQIRPLWNIN